MCCDGTIINPGLVRNQGTSESTGGTVIEDEEEEITGKVTTALWGYAFLPSKHRALEYRKTLKFPFVYLHMYLTLLAVVRGSGIYDFFS